MTVTAPERYLVIDLEGTCDDSPDRQHVPAGEAEIIEIGAVMVEADGWQVTDEFSVFIRPVRHPTLTAFCTRLTSITQADVDAAPTYPTAIERFKSWLYQHHSFLFLSWGDYDRLQLIQDCAYHRIAYPIAADHVNLKKAFSARQGVKKLGLGRAIERAGLTFVGTPHRGVDDARNAARLLPYAFGNSVLDPPPSARPARA